jgi:broad specificity phosphatase PhoE
VIYLIRHGETSFNVQKRHQGWVDSELTALGKEQALRAGLTPRRLTNGRNTVIFPSPLGRAVRTAGIIHETLQSTGPAVIDNDLKEIGMGSWEGKTEMEINAGAPRLSLHSPDGESMHALAARMRSALKRISQDQAELRIVVSHGVACRVIRSLWLGLDPTRASAMEQPQDAMFCLYENEEIRIPYREIKRS